ncbi:amino acid ABC transporter [Rhodococcus sp. 06-462-5]|uniref:ABC transporter substrate-binding protein n=1 Tax=unclassified Rhodococcus (in: high G+C Gram-positive bacteria) TaxID=192944 RepID=UPI000B9B6B1E|nr:MULTISPECIES: ABC transporter substrate-binding protein [unclassified Rhodococcus (in: high G+C Gram-positive bacteria)]OZC70814.1 amino acid ABC transporter [Rhodococcus sp. 06-462-5]OZE68733.1 amino acid ABC transporter [Rhodococcus sp. 02-925g]
MRKLTGLAAIAVVVAGLTACSSSDDSVAAPTDCTPTLGASDLAEEGVLTMATNATLPPMQYVDPNGDVIGMRVDLGKEIAKRLCLTPKFVNIEFEAQIPGVQAGRWDMIDTGMFYTPARAETIDLVPYEVQAVSISVPSGNPESISSVDDLAGKTIGVEAPGYEFDTLTAMAEQFAAEGKPALTVQTFKTNADAYQALSAGQLDGTSIVESVTSFYQEDGRFETAVGGINEAPLAMGFAKGSKSSAEVARVLSEMRSDGYLPELFEQYDVTGYDGDIAVSTGPLDS